MRCVAGKRKTPYVHQKALEGGVRAILETIALPKCFAEAVDAAVAAYVGQEGRRSRKCALKSLRRGSGA